MPVNKSMTISAPIYDIGKLAEKEEQEWTMFSSLDDWITKKGGYLALIVIIGCS